MGKLNKTETQYPRPITGFLSFCEGVSHHRSQVASSAALEQVK